MDEDILLDMDEDMLLDMDEDMLLDMDEDMLLDMDEDMLLDMALTTFGLNVRRKRPEMKIKVWKLCGRK